MKTLRRLVHRTCFLFICSFLLLTACASAKVSTTTSTDPQPTSGYVLVTANPQPSATPFLPSQPTETALPTQTASPEPTASATDTPLPTNTPINPPTPLPSSTPFQASPPEVPDRTQYVLSALMDYAGHTVNVSETVIYPNRSQDALDSIAMAINPNLWSGVFYLQTLSINDQPATNFTLSGQWLTINLNSPLQSGQAVKIGLDYQLTLPYSSAKFENFGYTTRQTNLIDWYPFVPPYRAGNWILPGPYAYGENLVYDKADFRVSLSFTDSGNTPVVAASAPAAYENGTLVYNLPNARNFTLSASPYYQVSTADANGVAIYNYYFASHANAAAMVLELTRMSVITYTEEFGPYPHTSLSVCETDLNDGLETDGLYFLASSFYSTYDGTVKNNLSTIAVHETAHQWWYGAIANNQATEPWLDEALATYSEHVFYEDNYPGLVNWWWAFRVNSHGTTGWVDSRVYDTGNFSSYITAVYFNGARFLQQLRDRIGDQVFFTFLRDYYSRSNGRIVTAFDFFAILDLNTSADYSDLVNSYFYYR